MPYDASRKTWFKAEFSFQYSIGDAKPKTKQPPRPPGVFPFNTPLEMHKYQLRYDWIMAWDFQYSIGDAIEAV